MTGHLNVKHIFLGGIAGNQCKVLFWAHADCCYTLAL